MAFIFLPISIEKNMQKQNILIIEDQKSETTNLNSWLTGDENDGQLLLDVYQDKKNIYVKSTIAGVETKDIQISINNDMLTIRGKREKEESIEKDDYFCQECYWGGFSRSIILPTEVKSDKISAALKNGVLTITLPKAERRHNIPIEIK